MTPVAWPVRSGLDHPPEARVDRLDALLDGLAGELGVYIELRSDDSPNVLSRMELYVFIDEFFRLRGDAISNDDKVYLTWLVYIRLVSPDFVYAPSS